MTTDKSQENETEDTILGRKIRLVRAADEKLRRGDSISNDELRLLRRHYTALELSTSILPQFYCAHQEANRRLQQIESYLRSRKDLPEPVSEVPLWTTQLLDHDTKG